MSVTYHLRRVDLISPGYLETQRELHARPNGYGGKGDKWAQGVAGLIQRFDASSVLDYGCGEGSLKKALKAMDHGRSMRLDEYDPAVKGLEHWPIFADLVVCTDVLEHVEPDKLDAVLQHLQVLARKAVFLVVATRPSNKTLMDGRNAHLIQESDTWWQARVHAAGLRVLPDPPVSPLAKRSREWVAVLKP